MNFYGDDAQIELGSDALVHLPRDDVAHDLPFALRELVVASPQRRESGVVTAPRTITLYGRMNGVEQHLVIEWFGEELCRASLHRTHGHRHIAMPGDEDDRQRDSCFREFLLKCQSAHSGQTHVEYETTRRVEACGLHEFGSR